MKKRIIIALILLLTVVVAIMLAVMPRNLSMTDAVAAEGESVYLTVSLEKTVTTNAMAISYEYDASVLEPLRSDSQWIPESLLQDFSEFGSHGVWGAKETVAVSGDICTLAFRILPNAEFKRSTVRCLLTIQNEDGEKTYRASAKITPACDHEYGSWVDAEQGEHTRTCILCNHVQNQSHVWKNSKADGLASICTVCGGQQTDQVNEDLQSGLTTGESPWGGGIGENGQWGSTAENDTTEPVQDSISSNEASSENHMMWGNQDNQQSNSIDGNGLWGNAYGENSVAETTKPIDSTASADNSWMAFYPTQETTAPTTEETTEYQNPSWMGNLDTSIFQQSSTPTETGEAETQDTNHTTPTEDLHEGHDHTQTVQKIDPLTACVVLGVLLLGGIFAFIFLKKKKHQ